MPLYLMVIIKYSQTEIFILKEGHSFSLFFEIIFLKIYSERRVYRERLNS